jgi:hypothetical protein
MPRFGNSLEHLGVQLARWYNFFYTVVVVAVVTHVTDGALFVDLLL